MTDKLNRTNSILPESCEYIDLVDGYDNFYSYDGSSHDAH